MFGAVRSISLSIQAMVWYSCHTLGCRADIRSLLHQKHRVILQLIQRLNIRSLENSQDLMAVTTTWSFDLMMALWRFIQIHAALESLIYLTELKNLSNRFWNILVQNRWNIGLLKTQPTGVKVSVHLSKPRFLTRDLLSELEISTHVKHCIAQEFRPHGQLISWFVKMESQQKHLLNWLFRSRKFLKQQLQLAAQH